MSKSILFPLITEAEYYDLRGAGIVSEAQELMPYFRDLINVTKIFKGNKEQALIWWKSYIPTLDIKEFVNLYRYEIV